MPPPPRILLAPDKFKGSITAAGFCESVTEGLSAKLPHADIRALPLADGGDGTLDVLSAYLDLRRVDVPTLDPLGRPLTATYLADDTRAYVEVAAASGLARLADTERDPLRTSTYGTGLLVKHAVERGARHVYLLLGGSATNDAGLGIAQALGFGLPGVIGHITGGQLSRLEGIRLPAKPTWAGVSFTLLCDVDNPLYGPRGAAHVYARQKGASDEQIATLDAGLRHASTFLAAFAKTDIAHLPGGGAAGGIGAGLVALLGAELRPGFDAVADLAQLDEHIAWADVVITGEGQLDGQSFRGKVVGEVLARALARGKPCHALVGRNALPAAPAPPATRTLHAGLASVTALVDLAPNEISALEDPRPWLAVAARQLAQLLERNP